MAFLDEVAQHGKVLRDLVRFYRTEGEELFRPVQHMASRRPRSLIFTGMGSSEFASEVLMEYLAEKCPIPVVRWEAGELLHFGLESIRDDDVIVAVSQSGESVETRRVVEHLRYHERLITVTNDPESYMARHASLNLPILAGEEATISNKTYTNTIAALMIFARVFTGDEVEPLLCMLETSADKMECFLAGRRSEVGPAAELLKEASFVYFISRGPAMAAARQAALTYQEGVHLYTSVLPGGSFRHGPFEIAGPGHHAVMFASDGHGGDLVRSMALEMAELGSKVVLFTSQEVSRHPNMVTLDLTCGEPQFFTLGCAVPQELLLERMASDRGLTAGVFERGSKITSKE